MLAVLRTMGYSFTITLDNIQIGSRDDNKVTKQTERDLKHLILAENSSVYGV
jgi:hypothetical protein